MSGKLIKNALVMYDHQTDTLWSQFLSRGVRGPLANTALEIVPALQTTWQQWLELHPDTLVLDKRGRYQSDTYDGYYRGGSAGILGEFNKDNRLSRKDLVLGVAQNGAAKAFSFQSMAEQPVINDIWAGIEILVVFERVSETGAVFERTLGGRSLSFQIVPGDSFLMRDQQTGSTWQVLTGRAIEGPLAGEVLTRLTSNYSFWFAWTDFYPDTLLYQGLVPSGSPAS